MGCMASSQRVNVSNHNVPWQFSGKGEPVLQALARLDEEIASSEKSHPAARLAVVTAEMDVIQQEIKTFEEVTTSERINKDTYAKTLHQLFISLDLYRRPMLAAENEDFVANVNRKQMRQLELSWLRTRYGELQRERRVLHAQMLRTRSLYTQLQQLLDRIWGSAPRPGTPTEGALTRAGALRDALASVSAKLRAAAVYAHAAARLVDDALPAWKLISVGKSGWERTAACADACQLLVRARCVERGARRVLSAPAAPRAARTLRLALDYAFTDAMHDHKLLTGLSWRCSASGMFAEPQTDGFMAIMRKKCPSALMHLCGGSNSILCVFTDRYQRATEVFVQFKEALVQLISSIHQVLLNNLENLAVAEKDVTKCRRELRAARVNGIMQQGLAGLRYESRVLTSLKSVTFT